MHDDAAQLLPSSIHTSRDIKIAIEQLINYTNARALPLFFDLMNYLAKIGMLRVAPAENPLLPLMPILNEWNLSVNWAIGASALALIEVMVNKNLKN